MAKNKNIRKCNETFSTIPSWSFGSNCYISLSCSWARFPIYRFLWENQYFSQNQTKHHQNSCVLLKVNSANATEKNDWTRLEKVISFQIITNLLFVYCTGKIMDIQCFWTVTKMTQTYCWTDGYLLVDLAFCLQDLVMIPKVKIRVDSCE